MAVIINSIERLFLMPQSLFFSIPIPIPTHRYKTPKPYIPPFTLTTLRSRKLRHRRPVKSCAQHHEIDMVRTLGGAYASKAKKVVVLWDLDNKPPRGPPYEAALAIRSVAQSFGDVVDVSAYANRHAFAHLPQWIVEERRERRRLDLLERRGVTPVEPCSCSVCGRKFSTHLDLKRHFKQLHLRERQKKLNRMRSLKGKKRMRFKERFIDGNEKYNEAARSLLTPKVGYGLAQELRRAGVQVRMVQDKPQAADWALKRQLAHSMSRGVDWIVLVSDDSDFSEMLRKSREANLGTVVVGDRDRALGRHADVWVPWIRVENGEIEERDLELRREFDETGMSFSFEGDEERLGISCFSEGEYEEDYLSDSEDSGEETDFLL